MRARRGTRLKSGRLKKGERRRRLNAAAPRPGEVVILDRSRRRTRGRRSRGSWQVELAVQTQFSADLDVRKLVHVVRLALAEHFRASLLSGRQADGSGALPELKAGEGRKRFGVARAWGVDSGFMAENWLIFPIRGGPFAASALLKPNGRDGRSFMINNNLRRGIDLQAIDGAAAEVIRATTEVWLRDAIPNSGDGVATPARVPLAGGTLREMRRNR